MHLDIIKQNFVFHEKSLNLYVNFKILLFLFFPLYNKFTKSIKILPKLKDHLS